MADIIGMTNILLAIPTVILSFRLLLIYGKKLVEYRNNGSRIFIPFVIVLTFALLFLTSINNILVYVVPSLSIFEGVSGHDLARIRTLLMQIAMLLITVLFSITREE